MAPKPAYKSAAIVLAAATVISVLAGCATGISHEEAATAYYDLGNAYFDLLRYDDAVRAYSRAMDLNPDILQAGYNLARVYIETGRIDEGISLLEDLAATDPGNTNVLATLAWARYRQDDLNGALSGYKKVLERIGNDKDALYNSAVISWKIGDLSSAAEYFEHYYERYPDTETLLLLGKLYTEVGDPQNALNYLEIYAAETKPSVDTLLTMARLYEDTEAYGKAASVYAEALDRDSSLAESRFYYARILLEKIEDYGLGMEQIRVAIESGYEDYDALLDLVANARSYYKEDLQNLLNEKGLLIAPSTEKEDG